MKIVVFSDSHQDIESMVEVVKKIKPNMIIHLGDYINDALNIERQFIEIPIEYVKGNCDIYSTGAAQKILNIENKKILITHGDLYGVRNGTSEILHEGIRQKADLILYGHTHRPVIKKKKGITLMNPGSIGKYSRGPWHQSFGLIHINGNIKCSLGNYDVFSL